MKVANYWKFEMEQPGYMLKTVAAWSIWGLKVKIDYLILDAKLLLINVNYVEFFLFLEIL